MSLVYCIEYLIESIAQTQHEISKTQPHDPRRNRVQRVLATITS